MNTVTPLALGVILLSGGAARAADVTFPDHPNVVHVTRPPYSARGDGVTDDTAALQCS